YIDIPLNQNYYRNTLAVIDLIANFNWTRPIYWGVTVPSNYNLGIDRYTKNEGLANLLVPQLLPQNDGYGSVTDANSVYEKIMNTYVFRNLNNEKVYYDETYRRMIATYRNMLIRTTFALVNEGKEDKAKDILNKYTEIFTAPKISYYYSGISLVEALYLVKETEKAIHYSDILAEDAEDLLRYYKKLSYRRGELDQERNHALQKVMALAQIAKKYKQEEQEKKLMDILTLYR
ncbi:MAG: hypothetical protein LBH34_01700, partial [Prevotellaceae bacterium]|nr:hypothetical protein [Prevotellaceae bacterium]